MASQLKDHGVLLSRVPLRILSRPTSWQVSLDEVPAPTPAPVTPTGAFGGVPASIPGTVEAEAFDYGGEGVGYSDSDPGNNGGVRDTWGKRDEAYRSLIDWLVG